MESRKKRLGPSKFGVWYENQRASWQSERTLASLLSRHSGLSWNSGVLMKTSEGISFSIAHLSRLKQLRCKPGQKLPWFVNEKPPKRTNLPILSIASYSPLKAWTTKDRAAVVMITCHFFLILIGSEKIREILWHLEVTKIRFEIIISQASHTFFPTRYLNLFF